VQDQDHPRTWLTHSHSISGADLEIDSIAANSGVQYCCMPRQQHRSKGSRMYYPWKRLILERRIKKYSVSVLDHIKIKSATMNTFVMKIQQFVCGSSLAENTNVLKKWRSSVNGILSVNWCSDTVRVVQLCFSTLYNMECRPKYVWWIIYTLHRTNGCRQVCFILFLHSTIRHLFIFWSVC